MCTLWRQLARQSIALISRIANTDRFPEVFLEFAGRMWITNVFGGARFFQPETLVTVASESFFADTFVFHGLVVVLAVGVLVACVH